MQAKEIVCFLTALVLFSGLICTANALSVSTVSFGSSGVRIDLTFPEEGRPLEGITHNVTITSTTQGTLHNFTIVVGAQVNQSWQEIFTGSDTLIKTLPMSYSLPIQLPENVNGVLQCLIFINTSIIGDLSAKVYTTVVNEFTFSEIHNLYHEILVNYSSLRLDNEALLSEFNELLRSYESLLIDYSTLIKQHDNLLLEHDSLNFTSNDVQKRYNTLKNDFDEINQTYQTLLNDIDVLQQEIIISENALSADRIIIVILVIVIAVLVSVMVFTKRKGQKPYVVVHKRKVAIMTGENSPS
jgi:hypothetical protein